MGNTGKNNPFDGLEKLFGDKPKTVRNAVDDMVAGVFDRVLNDGKLPPGLTDGERNELEYRAMVAEEPCPTCLTMLNIKVVHGR